jgi:predicted PolB exonuclease-like 3'-5' exonuclease
MESRKILAFDIETYPDLKLVEAQGTDLSSFRDELKRRTGSDFLPPIFHVPIAIAFLEVHSEFREMRVEVLTAVPDQERSLVGAFWQKCDDLFGATDNGENNGLLVSFNGMEFDIPVLEIRALKYALRGNLRARDSEFHFDVPLFLANYQPSRKRGLRLATLSQLAGLPGKALLEGSMVESRFKSGLLREIGTYCLLDVLQTYFLFLRCQLLSGMTSSAYIAALRSFTLFLSTSDDPNVREVFSYLEGPLQSAISVESVR